MPVKIRRSAQGQAMPRETVALPPEAFGPSDTTTVWWLPSDSCPLPEFLEWESAPDMMLFDFADNGWHIGFADAVELANQYPDSDLLLIHWGCVDAPEYTPFNGDPERLEAAVKNPERVHALGVGEGFRVKRK